MRHCPSQDEPSPSRQPGRSAAPSCDERYRAPSPLRRVPVQPLRGPEPPPAPALPHHRRGKPAPPLPRAQRQRLKAEDRMREGALGAPPCVPGLPRAHRSRTQPNRDTTAPRGRRPRARSSTRATSSLNPQASCHTPTHLRARLPPHRAHRWRPPRPKAIRRRSSLQKRAIRRFPPSRDARRAPRIPLRRKRRPNRCAGA